MNQQAGAEVIQERTIGTDMVEVAVGVDDLADAQAMFVHCGDDSVGIASGIHDQPFTGLFASQEVTVDSQGAHNNYFKYHRQSLP